MEAARLADEVTNKNTADQKNELNKIKVLIVDDSPIMSKIINSMLEADQLIEVVKCAKNGEEALEIIRISPPDIITMDVNMPVMDGSTALKHIMIESPCPVMIMSNLGDSSYSTILNFMNLGAVDFMSKPVKNKNIVLQQQKMVERIRLSSKAKIKRFKRIRFPKIDLAGKLIVNENKNSEKLIIINSGVGGYLEMVNLILNIPCDDQTTIVSIQAIPPLFTPVLSNFLNSRSIYDVKPISNKNILCANRCYIGSNGIKLNIKYSSSLNDLTTEPDKEDSHDQNDFFNKLLLHASRAFKDRVIVVLLSGAELKGMEGLSAIKQNGGRIITPQLSSCILPTTLEPIVDKGIVDHMINLENIASILKNKTPVG
jgi:two-component system chemotaxis response regulator CheB